MHECPVPAGLSRAGGRAAWAGPAGRERINVLHACRAAPAGRQAANNPTPPRPACLRRRRCPWPAPPTSRARGGWPPAPTGRATSHRGGPACPPAAGRGGRMAWGRWVRPRGWRAGAERAPASACVVDCAVAPRGPSAPHLAARPAAAGVLGAAGAGHVPAGRRRREGSRQTSNQGAAGASKSGSACRTQVRPLRECWRRNAPPGAGERRGPTAPRPPPAGRGTRAAAGRSPGQLLPPHQGSSPRARSTRA